MAVWSGLGMNYKSLTKTVQDIAYFNNIGIRYIRPHIPYYTDSVNTLNNWRTVAKTFHDAGFWVTYGLSAGSIGSSTWDALSAAVLAEAATCQSQDVCDDFLIGNEYELHLIDGWTQANDLIPALKTLATSVQAVFTRGTVSYSISQGKEPAWISAGKGDIDLIGLNTYSVLTNSSYIDPSPYKSAITNLFTAFGNSGSFISEFNLDSNGARMDTILTKYDLSRTGIINMIDYIESTGYTKALFFQWCPPSDIEGSGLFYVANNDRTFKYMWNGIINGSGRISFIES